MPSPSLPRNAPGRERDWSFDVARLVAALAVIVVHSPGLDHVPAWSLPLRFAVPFFCCSAVHFAFLQYATRRPPMTLLEYADDRFERVYRPFVIWSLIYVLVQLSAYWVGLADREPVLGLQLFLLGGAAHLWFIPFILAAGVIAYAGVPIVVLHPNACGTAAGVVAIALAAWQAQLPVRPEDLPLLPQFAARSTAVFAGAAIAAWMLGTARSIEMRRTVGIVGLAFAGIGSWLAATSGGSRVMWGIAIGVSAYCVCLGGWRQQWMRTVGSLGPYSLGVYFAHYAFIEGYEDIARKVFGIRIDSLANAALVALSIASAIVVVWVLARRPATRFLVR
ncbi:MAG: acyltransferase family protein [Phycisphaerales bacterium]